MKHAAPVAAVRWLTLIGIGEDGVPGLSPAARRAIEQAELVIGGARHLAFVEGLGQGQRMKWPTPLTDAVPAILAWRGRNVCVVASGDPFFYGVGATLVAAVPPDEIACLPAPSSFSLAAARLGWPLQDCTPVSLHGRAFERIVPHLQPGGRLLALSWDGTTPSRLAQFLSSRGMGRSRLTICEALGGAREHVTHVEAQALAQCDFDPLNIIAVEIVGDREAIVVPLACGLPDDMFESDGQITKREIRAITLSALSPHRGQMLWDVGAGSGSISIEWCLRHPANRAIAIEMRADRAACIGRNALTLGVPDLVIKQDRAPDAFSELSPPDAIFVGGGATDVTLLDMCWAKLPLGGRLVVNAVTLETQAELMQRRTSLGGDLITIQISRADPVGQFHGWRPALPVVQWAVIKERET